MEKCGVRLWYRTGKWRVAVGQYWKISFFVTNITSIYYIFYSIMKLSLFWFVRKPTHKKRIIKNNVDRFSSKKHK